MNAIKRRVTPTVKVGGINIGSCHPVVIQSMTNTPTSETKITLNQIIDLIKAGSEMVRITINDERAALSAVKIIQSLRRKKYSTPIIGDFHFNGHILLKKYPQLAESLDKYRINPGNVGAGKFHNSNFAEIIKIALKNKKAVRIGVNWGSLDSQLLDSLTKKNLKIKNPKNFKTVIYDAMVKSALMSAKQAEKIGLKKDKIILSVKMSDLQDMINVYKLLAKKCDYALHIGLTEAGSDLKGIISSSAALAILLQQGIGDTIRISLTPQPGSKRTKEVYACKELLQTMGLRYFSPTVISCPGCGRTNSNYFQILANEIKKHVSDNLEIWQKKYKGIEKLKIAVMGCVVNGPGESKHADIAINLPGTFEKPIAPVYVHGKKIKTLSGKNIKKDFISLVDNFISRNF